MKELIYRLTKKDFDLQTFTSGGKGGQHQNRSNTGVRITHKESGATGVSRDTRSQAQNKKLAFQRLLVDPKFKIWTSRKVLEFDYGKKLEQVVEESMTDDKLKVEVRKDGQWVTWLSVESTE